MKEIKLTHGKVALVDDEDFDYLNQWNWYAKKHERNWYAYRNSWLGEKSKRMSLMMHREILKITNSKTHVDHINHDGLDNRRINIRACTRQQNAMNSAPSGKYSKYKGVTFCINSKKFMAQLNTNGKKYLCKRCNSEIEAALAYNTVASLHFGEFAHLNVVPPVRFYQKPMLIPVI